MPVKLKPTNKIKSRLGLDKDGRVQKFFTNTCYKHMDKYVPQDSGDLRTIVDIQSDSITYESNYAHAQYTGIVNGSEVKNYTTPGTGPYWDKLMVSAEGQKVIKEVEDYIRR